MRYCILAVLVILAADSTARAQTVTAGQWRDRGYFAVSGNYQATSSSFTDFLTFPQFVETETVTSLYKVDTAPGLDIAGGVRIWRNMAVGVAVTRFTKTNSATVSASIPHPFFFNAPRQVSGEAGGVQHEETAVHIQAAWVAPVGRRWQITVFGGPSLFNVTQGLVAGITVSETYPYDTATFTSASVQQESKSKVGVNAGVDVAFMFSRNIGVGGVVRFSRSTLSFDNASGQAVDVDAGGAQVGTGLRVRF